VTELLLMRFYHSSDLCGRPACRRKVQDASGEWTEDPEASMSLNRLLCRPLSHLWQDTPLSQSKQGNARWAALAPRCCHPAREQRARRLLPG
jgi:hypothetical protein